MTRPVAFVVLSLLCALTSTARAQEPADTPAFSLASSTVFSSTSTPEVTLTFERLSSLDFRV